MARAAVLRPVRPGYARRSIRRNVRGIFTFFFVTALLGAAAYGLYQYVNQSEYLRVKSIRIDGAHLVRTQDIVAAAGISNEDNILFLNSRNIRERVEAMPYVKSCSVDRTFPDMVSIAIEERYPVATLIVHNHPYEVDADMQVLRRLHPDEPHTGPLISQVAELGAIEPGTQLTQAPLKVAIDVWQAFSETSMAQDVTVSEISADAVNDIRMYCDELPFEIRWGRDDVQRQAKNLEVLWQQRGSNLTCKEYLDLRFGQDIACK